MKERDTFLKTSTARLAALLADQQRLLEVIRREKTELVRVDRPVSAKSSPLPTRG